MNFRTTAILFIILVVVGLLVLLTRETERPQTDLPTAQKLLTLAPADVTKISIAPADGQRVVLDRAGGKWQLTEPVNAPAEESTVATLVSSITGLETRGEIAADATTGFDAPAYKLELTTSDSKTIKLDVGKRSGTGGNLYVRVDGASRADVVPDAVMDQLGKEVKEWRRKRLFDTPSGEIRQVRIATTQQSIVLEKHDADWKMTQPAEMPADMVAVSSITSALANLTAVDFAAESSDNSARFGLDQPQATASFSTEAPATQPSATQPAMTTIQFGRYDDILKRNLYASTSGSPGVVTVAASVLDSLRKTPIELRDKRVLDIDPEKVTKLTITTDKPATTQPTTQEASSNTVVLERTKMVVGATTGPSTGPATAQAATQPASKWNVASADGAPADDTKVDMVLNSFHPLRAVSFVESPSELKDPTVYTVIIETTDATHTLKVSKGTGVSDPPRGEYSGLAFTLGSFFTDDLAGDFLKPDTAPTPFTMPPGMPGLPQ